MTPPSTSTVRVSRTEMSLSTAACDATIRTLPRTVSFSPRPIRKVGPASSWRVRGSLLKLSTSRSTIVATLGTWGVPSALLNRPPGASEILPPALMWSPLRTSRPLATGMFEPSAGSS
jgi:hypothetical protein